jgi:alpha-tubulin suppressor-like RCC1 family protein
MRYGSLWSWGYNTGGELGDGSTTRHSGPVAIEVGSTFIGVAAGALDSFALRADGSLRAFGTNAVGQLGCPSCSTTTPTKSPVTIGANYQFVAAGADFTLAVTADGNLQTWGNDGSGQLGRAGATNTPTIIPDSSIGTFANIKPGAVTGGSATSESPTSAFNGARIKSSGVLEMWGDYGDSAFATKALGLATGQTGTVNEYASCDTTNKICWSPLPVAYQHKSSGNVLAAPWREVATGANTTLAISADGTLWAWGLNASGEAGVGNTASVDLPTQVSGSTTIPWLRVFADPAGFGTVAIKADGSLWQWGAGATSTPAQKCTSGACSGKHFSVVTVDSNGTLAIATDGSLWGWTNNGAPLQVNGSNPSVGPTGTAWSALTWIDVQVHAQDSEAVDSGGNVWSWGYNVYGQIGNGTVTADGLYPLPVIEQASVMTNAVNVASCPTSELALDAQNQLWGWGENGNGETGLQTSAIEWATNAYTGHQPGSGQTIGTNWFAAPILSAIACGGADSLLLDDDG